MVKMNNKKGFIRILEATIAIMIVAGVLLVAYSKQQSVDNTSRDYIYSIQKKILDDISLRDDLRNAVLQSNDTDVNSDLKDYVTSQVPSNFGHSIKVCNLENPPTPCKMFAEDFVNASGADIYVDEALVSANLSEYDPKRVRIFIWEKI